MIGVLFNTLTVIVGSSLGLLLKNGIKEKYKAIIMSTIGLCNIGIGVSGIIRGQNALVLIISMLLGTLLGTLLDIDAKMNFLGNIFASKFSKQGEKSSVAQGFVAGSLLFCVGSMTIVGSLQSGISNDHSLIFTKAILDLFSSAILASSLGFGVCLSSVFVFVFQGALVLLASYLAPFLSEAVVAEISCIGGVMILALGLNLLEITKIKVADTLPALIFVPLTSYLFSLFI